jgi:hypothetical protein
LDGKDESIREGGRFVKFKGLLVLATVFIVLLGTLSLIYLQNQPDGKVRGAESLRNAERNSKFQQIVAQNRDADLFSYGAELYVKMESQQASGLRVEQEPLFEIHKQYRGEGEFPDLTATNLPPGSKVYKVADSPNMAVLAVYVHDQYVLYKNIEPLRGERRAIRRVLP